MTKPLTLAVVDIGSNSFHLLVADYHSGKLMAIKKVRERVQLARYLDEKNHLSSSGIEKSLRCLRRFAEVVSRYPCDGVMLVATNTVRVASNQVDFLCQAEPIFGKPIRVLTGLEEARFIYRGAVFDCPAEIARLVIDIGGGSTEIIVGCGEAIHYVTSLPVGCLNMTQRFFPQGHTVASWQALLEFLTETMRPLQQQLAAVSWQMGCGCSGTIQAVSDVAKAHGWHKNGVNKKSVNQIVSRLLAADWPEMPGMNNQRLDVFPAGAAILYSLFHLLNIEDISMSAGALREGVILTMATEITQNA